MFELLNEEIEKACRLTEELNDIQEKINEKVSKLNLEENEKQKLIKCVEEYINYGYFANVSLEKIIKKENELSLLNKHLNEKDLL